MSETTINTDGRGPDVTGVIDGLARLNEPLDVEVDRQIQLQQARIAELTQRCTKHHILSTLPSVRAPAFWATCVDSIAFKPNFLSKLTSRFGIPDITLPLRLLVRAHRYDLVLLSGGERADLVYLAIAGLLPWVRTRHVIADAHWQKADGIAYQLQKLLLRLGRRLTVQVQPHSVEETVVYHELFGIPREQLRAVPWSTTLMGHDVSPAKPEEAGEFVLTGGTSFRDYPTLLEAVRGLDLHLKIGVPQRLLSRGLADRLSGFPNVSVHTNWTNAQFIRQMASCRVFALPIQPGLTRSTADQTILNAMYFGKIVVATDSIGPRIYIKDGVNGFLVPEASVSRWRETLEKVQRLSDNELAEIGRRAAYDARVRFNEPLLLVRTLEEALDAAP